MSTKTSLQRVCRDLQQQRDQAKLLSKPYRLLSILQPCKQMNSRLSFEQLSSFCPFVLSKLYWQLLAFRSCCWLMESIQPSTACWCGTSYCACLITLRPSRYLLPFSSQLSLPLHHHQHRHQYYDHHTHHHCHCQHLYHFMLCHHPCHHCHHCCHYQQLGRPAHRLSLLLINAASACLLC